MKITDEQKRRDSWALSNSIAGSNGDNLVPTEDFLELQERHINGEITREEMKDIMDIEIKINPRKYMRYLTDEEFEEVEKNKKAFFERSINSGNGSTLDELKEKYKDILTD